MKFDDFVTDAVIDYFKEKNKYSKVFMSLDIVKVVWLWHACAKDKANGFVCHSLEQIQST
jgi:hypothetical protein